MKTPGTTYWTSPNNTTTHCGFSEVGAGVRWRHGGLGFILYGTNGYFWSDSQTSSTHAYQYSMTNVSQVLFGGDNNKSWGMSIRLIKD